MITALLTFLVVALIVYLVWYLIGLFIQGTPHQVIGIILGVILLIYALKLFGLATL